MRNRVKGWLRKLNFKYLSIAFLLLLAVFVVYFWHLAKLTPGLSPAEVSARASSTSLHSILHNPLNAPQRLLQYAAQKAGHHEAFSMRLASVLMALVFVGCLFWLMQAWFGLTIGIFGTLIFATTPLVVLLARSATAGIMLLTPLAVLAAYVWLLRRPHKTNVPWLVLVIVGSASLYEPGLAWLLLAGLVLGHRRILMQARTVQRTVLVLSALITILILVPLILALVKNISLFHGFLLIPGRWPGTIGLLKSITWSALALVWRVHFHNPLIIGRLALLDVLQISLVIFGAYVMWARARKETLALIGLVIAGVFFAGLNNNLLILTLSLPALALLAAAGLRYLYVEWRGIFPKNPLPLSFALILISVLVGLQVAYGLRYSLIAWPHTTATKQLYVLK